MRVNPFLQITSSVEGAEYLHHYKALRINGEGDCMVRQGTVPCPTMRGIVLKRDTLQLVT